MRTGHWVACVGWERWNTDGLMTIDRSNKWMGPGIWVMYVPVPPSSVFSGSLIFDMMLDGCPPPPPPSTPHARAQSKERGIGISTTVLASLASPRVSSWSF